MRRKKNLRRTNLREAEVRNVLEFIANRSDVRRVVPKDARGLELLLWLRADWFEPEERLKEPRLGHDGKRELAKTALTNRVLV